MQADKPHERYEELITMLIGAMGQRSLYHRNHPRVLTATAEFVRGLLARVRADGKPVFFLGLVEGRLVHDGRLLFGSTLVGRKLLTFADRLHCGGFLFREDLRDEDVLALLDLYAELRSPLASLQEARERLGMRTQAIQLSPLYNEAGWFGQHVNAGNPGWSDATGSPDAAAMAGVYQSLFDTVETAHGKAATDSAIDVNATRGVAEGLLGSTNGRLHDVLRLVRYPSYDSYTVGHSVRVALLAVQVGMSLGLEPHALLELGTAGLLHDVGKAKIPQEILFKPSRLDEEERRIVSRHPRLGAELLLEQQDAGPLSVGAAFGHHLRQDRRGYPKIPSWHAIGRGTALIHVCDVFEALTAIRPYKAAFSPRRAFEIMVADTGCFHPGALAALVRSMGLYPPGSRVQLSTGERALVISAGADLERPCVSITHDRTGKELEVSRQERRDLAQIPVRDLSIARLLDDGPRPGADRDELKEAC